MISAPVWVLTLAYWLHMLATVIWLGGLSAQAILVLPALRRSLTGDVASALLNQYQNRLNRLGWISLTVLARTAWARAA